MSYAAIVNLAPDNTSDATFRVWGSGISAALTSMGVVMSSDTGQINWTTVSKPAAANSVSGYEIWKFNDTLQATVPWFFKIEYGASANSQLQTSLWLTAGTGSNGSGTLTGQLSTRIQIGAAATSTSNYPFVFSGDTNRIEVILSSTLANAATGFFAERTKNADGSDSSLGVMLTTIGSSNPRWQQFIPTTGTVPAAITDVNAASPAGSSAGAFGSDLAIYPHFLTRGGAYLNACTTHVSYWPADLTVGATFTMTMYGATRTFYVLGGNIPSVAYLSSAANRANLSALSMAMRYD